MKKKNLYLISFLKLLAIPFLLLYLGILKGLIWLFIIFRWVYSLFTDKPIIYKRYTAWYWVRGKKKSMRQIMVDKQFIKNSVKLEDDGSVRFEE